MIGQHRWKLLLSSLVILLPIPVGLFLWHCYPDAFSNHWGAASGQQEIWGVALRLAVLPVILLIGHWICLAFTLADPKNKGQNPKAMGMIFWLVPVISLLICGVSWSAALGRAIESTMITPALLGALFACIGNYLPKLRQNNTFGIKVSWALQDEENWNRTHRLAGKIWVIGGLVMLFSIFLPMPAPFVIMPVVPAALALGPMLYSYWFYRQQRKTGRISSQKANHKWHKGSMISLAAAVVITLGVAVLLFTGEIQIVYGENSFSVHASYWSDLTVEYAAIDHLEYQENCPAGYRTNGFGSLKLSMGAFENEAFGGYTRYSYNRCSAGVVLEVDGKTLVLNGADEESTYAIYQQLSQQTGLH